MSYCQYKTHVMALTTAGILAVVLLSTPLVADAACPCYFPTISSINWYIGQYDEEADEIKVEIDANRYTKIDVDIVLTFDKYTTRPFTAVYQAYVLPGLTNYSEYRCRTAVYGGYPGDTQTYLVERSILSGSQRYDCRDDLMEALKPLYDIQ